ncbi:VanW family protein [Nocardioides houyundeii]|uniref:VanW family protein n=1 Tax=Nocardioides houyundeii TaxID=2045452 RepID=UPI000DF1105F|nr:VanW family protein [Nocardioides houyundeii]
MLGTKSAAPQPARGPVDDDQEKAGGRVVALLLLGLLVLVLGGYAVAHQLAGDKVPRGATVSGIKIGGHSPEKAAKVLERGLAERAAAPIELVVDGKPRSVTPEQAGLSVDYRSSVADAGGEDSWSPGRLWDYFTGGDDRDAVVVVDEGAMSALLDQVDSEAGRPAKEGAVMFKGGEVKTRNARTGLSLDRDAAREALETAYLGEPAQASADLVETEPEIDEADVQQALTSFANQAVSEPVTLTFEGRSVRLAPADYTPALSLVPQDGALVPQLDAEALADVVDGAVADKGGPVDATVELVNGQPTVIPDKPGASFDQGQIDAAFLDLVAAPTGQRTLAVDSTVAEAEFKTADAEALQIKEKVSSFTTYFPYAEYRNVNLGRAAELIDGTVLKPGETFSLNDTVGERTRENGFTEGFVISDGIFKEDLGGGVSQMATTVFNAMFFAGLEDVEHKPHSFYIDRYPVGREATVAWGAVDLRFRNNTDHGVLIDAKVSPSSPSSQGSVTVSMWSTKVWDITSSTSERYNFTPAQTRTLDTEDCYPNSGYGGFDVDVKRIFHTPGSKKVARTETFSTTYTPSDSVVCTPPAG